MSATILPIFDAVKLAKSESGREPGDVAAAGRPEALLGGVGVARLDDAAWLGVRGEDRVRWLNGMTTNSIQSLQPGEGCYNFILSAQGRIQGDGYAFGTPDEVLFETDRGQVSKLMELLDRFIIMDDVELREVSQAGLLCAGPKAAELLRALGIDTDGMGPLSRRAVSWRGIGLTVVAAYSPLVARVELWVATAEEREVVWAALVEGGAVGVDAAAIEALRMLEGTPKYGVDIRDRELPQETGQMRALHFAKGCYLGQEIVERIRSRGAVHRVFQAFRLEGDEAAAGAAITAGEKAVGELTSVAAIPLAGGMVQLGLGYIRREALERGEKLLYAGGVAVPVGVPFRVPVP